MRRMLCLALLLAAALLWPCLGLAQEDALPAYRDGDEFSVSFEITENPHQAVGVQLLLEYDHDALELIPSNTVRNDSPLMTPNLDGLAVGSGFKAEFRVRSGAQNGVYEIRVQVVAAGDLDENEVDGVLFSIARVRVGEEQESGTAQPEAQAEGNAALVTNQVYMMSNYQLGKRVRLLREGDWVTVLETLIDGYSQWCRVRASGQEGYLLASYLTFPIKTVADGDYLFDIVNGEAVLTKYLGPGGEVEIPFLVLDNVNTVVRIGEEAFAGREDITRVTIQENGIQSIGYGAFSGCANLSRVVIPASVQQIDDTAFDGCPKKLFFIVQEGSCAEEYCKAHGYKHKVE